MKIELNTTTLLTLMGIPSAITAFSFWLLQRSITRREKNREKLDEARKKNELLVIRGVHAAISLGEATAKSLKRLDPACNGDVNASLEYAQRVKGEQMEFLNEQSIRNLY